MSMTDKVANLAASVGGAPGGQQGPSVTASAATGNASNLGITAYAEGGIIDRPAKVMAGLNGPELIIPIKEEYIDMTVRDILKMFEAKKKEQDSAVEQSNQMVDVQTEEVPAPAAESLGPQKTASKLSMTEKVTKEENHGSSTK